MITHFIYGQDGRKVPITVPDTIEGRAFIKYLRIHDRAK